MGSPRTTYLIEKLIRNELSPAEFDEFLAGLRDEKVLADYSDLLSDYFGLLLSPEHINKTHNKY
jgi:hypothetical protein